MQSMMTSDPLPVEPQNQSRTAVDTATIGDDDQREEKRVKRERSASVDTTSAYHADPTVPATNHQHQVEEGVQALQSSSKFRL